MAPLDRLRENAENCFAIARQAPNEEVRARWFRMAQWWSHKAQELERVVVDDGPDGLHEVW